MGRDRRYDSFLQSTPLLSSTVHCMHIPYVPDWKGSAKTQDSSSMIWRIQVNPEEIKLLAQQRFL